MPAHDRKAFWRFDGDEPTILSKERIARRPQVAEPRSRAREFDSAPRPSDDASVVLRPQFGRVLPVGHGKAVPNQRKSDLPGPGIKLALVASAVVALAAIALAVFA